MATMTAPSQITTVTTEAKNQRIIYTITPPANGGSPITAYQIGEDNSQAITFDSGNISVAANLTAAAAYHLQSGHANTPGLELVSLPFGGNALRVTGGMGLGDLTFNVDIQQSAGAAGFLYYKDGSAPANDTDGTQINWSTGPNWTGNNYTAEWASGEVVDADVDRYYWIRASIATNITTGTVRVRFNYNHVTRTWSDITLTDNKYTLTGLTNGTAVTRYFRAVNAIGEGPASAAVTATPAQTAPEQITTITPTIDDSQISYAITAPDDGGSTITAYQISPNGTTGWTNITLTNGVYVLTGLTNGAAVTRYFRAVNAIGNGPASDAVTATPAIPVGVTFSGNTFGGLGTVVTLTTTFEEAVTGLTLSDYSTTAGTLSNFRIVSTTIARVDLTLPSTGKGDAVVTLSADAVSPANAVATYTVGYDVPAPPVIGSIASPLNFMVNTPIDFTVAITGVPDADLEVGVETEWKGLYYHVAPGGVLHLEGTPNELLTNKSLKITAKNKIQNLTAEFTGTYNVITAAPIIQRPMGTLKFVRGLMHNWIVTVSNLLTAFSAKGLAIGLKSKITEGGLSGLIDGKIPTAAMGNFTKTSGTVDLTAKNAGGVDTESNIPWEILATEPTLGAATVKTHHNYAEITIPDLDGARAYEYTLESGDDPTWIEFNANQPIIAPDKIRVVEHGQFSVTIEFPPVAGATAYEYQLVSEQGEGVWVRATHTIVSQMIRIIIPNLEEGTSYTGRFRVAQPWIGTQYVTVTFTAGRLVYVLNDPSSPSNASTTLYQFSTGVADGGQAVRTKRWTLPSAIIRPRGLAVDGTTVYVVSDENTDAVYVFDISSAADNATLTQTKKVNFPSGSFQYGLALDNNVLYTLKHISVSGTGALWRVSAATADGGTFSAIGTTPRIYISGYFTTPIIRSVVGDLLYWSNGSALSAGEKSAQNAPNRHLSGSKVVGRFRGRNNNAMSPSGIEYISNAITYGIYGDNILRFALNAANNRFEEVWKAGLPVGLTDEKYLSIQK